ncbi:MAG TPA: type I glutamate--ammonia ligase [Acidobacteriota bacterium]
MTREEVLATLKKQKIRFLRLQFTDILGINKNVEVPENQFEKALDGQVMFDGSSIEGFVRIEESDMLLVPDLETFRVLPWVEDRGQVARLICDVYTTEGEAFPGDPRQALKRVVGEANQLGFTMVAGPELEFFLFHKDQAGNPATITHDAGGYFDLTPLDKGEECRRAIVNALEAMHFEIEAAHHEVAPAQHEIDFKYADAITTADNIMTYRFVTRKIANDFGLHATFMPKPLQGVNGSGMHTHQSLFRGDQNAFFDPHEEYQLSEICKHYIGGLLRHAKGFCAITNPLVNSYKRLVPGYEAPTNITWSEKNRSPLVRIPARRGIGTRCELRMPDPSCNPYLALAVMLKSGLDGIAHKIDPGPPVNKNIFQLTVREKRKYKIEELPGSLFDAVQQLRKDRVVAAALGEHILEHYAAAKLATWHEYTTAVHPWEIERYLDRY